MYTTTTTHPTPIDALGLTETTIYPAKPLGRADKALVAAAVVLSVMLACVLLLRPVHYANGWQTTIGYVTPIASAIQTPGGSLVKTGGTVMWVPTNAALTIGAHTFTTDDSQRWAQR